MTYRRLLTFLGTGVLVDFGQNGGDPSVRNLTVYKVNVPYSVPYLYQPPILVSCGSESGYHKDMCLKAIGLCSLV